MSASAAVQQMHTALALLDVQPVVFDDGSNGLIVDASRLSDSTNDPRVWQLEFEDGAWHHVPSASSGPLGQMLWSIARAYQAFWLTGDAE